MKLAAKLLRREPFQLRADGTRVQVEKLRGGIIRLVREKERGLVKRGATVGPGETAREPGTSKPAGQLDDLITALGPCGLRSKHCTGCDAALVEALMINAFVAQCKFWQRELVGSDYVETRVRPFGAISAEVPSLVEYGAAIFHKGDPLWGNFSLSIGLGATKNRMAG